MSAMLTDSMTEGRFMNDNDMTAGGCQCGAVRYRIAGPLGDAGFCHCRMCQKAFGSFGAPLVSVASDRLQWTRGTPATFRSSPIVHRGFCRDCGTPLFMQEAGDHSIDIAIGTLDDPSALRARSCGGGGEQAAVGRYAARTSREAHGG